MPFTVLASSGGLTAVSEALTPSSGTQIPITDGTTITAGLFAQGSLTWTIKDANASFSGIVDDGATCDVSFDPVVGDVESADGDCVLVNPNIICDQTLMSDFDFQVAFDSAAAMNAAITHFGIWVGTGDTTDETASFQARFGRWQTTNGRNTCYWLSHTANATENAGDAVAWTTKRWMRIRREGSTLTASTSTDGSSWTDYASRKQDTAGSGCKAGIVFYNGHASATETVRFYEVTLTGTQWQAS